MFPSLIEMMIYGQLTLAKIPQIVYSYDEPYLQGLLVMVIYQRFILGSNIELNLCAVGRCWFYAPNIYTGWQVTHYLTDAGVYAVLYLIFAYNTVKTLQKMTTRL